MISKIWITFQAENIPGNAAKILKPSGCGPDVSDVLDLKIMDKRKIKVTIKLEATDDRVPNLASFMRKTEKHVKSPCGLVQVFS